MTSTEIKLQSPAKINWNLRILGSRDDGFHELESLVTPVSLFDDLVITLRPNNGEINLSCDLPEVPSDQTNLIWRAAELLARHGAVSYGVHCQLKKRIPLGGGLGGGSSNAATMLKGLNELWGLNWPVEKLLPLAAELGSDVPFFLNDGPAVMRGRGEQIEPVEPPWEGWVLLVLPGVNISTRQVYQTFSRGKSRDYGSIISKDNFNAVEWMATTFNMLEPPARQVCPSLTRWMEEAARLAGRQVRLSGSGSTFFTAFDHEEETRETAAAIREAMGLKTMVVHTGTEHRD